MKTRDNKPTPIRIGMVGGGEGSFIGYVHRLAMSLDGEYQLVAGALSSNSDIAVQSGLKLGLDRERIYQSFEEMAQKEAQRKDGIEVVSIVTPNHVHYEPIKIFLEHGIHVICDKPLTSTLKDAQNLAKIKPKNNAKFMLTHNYTAYSLVRKAREMVMQGELGKIRMVKVEYAQDWLSRDISNKQADWRTDPKRAGLGGAIGDIGTHAYNLMRFVTQLSAQELSADLQSFVAGRKLDDNANIMMRLENGARANLWISQIAIGNENNLTLRVYGDKGGLEWAQERPNELLFSRFGKPKQIITKAGANSEAHGVFVRTPSGHPEGYIEAFATLYRDFALTIRSNKDNELLPSLNDGIEGVEFINACVVSSQNNGKWVEF